MFPAILYKIVPTLLLLAYDGEEDEAAKAAAEEARKKAEEEANRKKTENKTFTQDELNRVLAEERRKAKAQNERLATELEALKSKASLSQQERDDLEQRIESLRSEHMTKEELAKQEKEKLDKKYKSELEVKTKEAEGWRTKYTQSTITRAITDAAIATKAFNPKQIVAQLASEARLVEVLDDANKPTGEHVTKVKITEKDKEGKEVTLDLTVQEAVKKMSEQEEFANLFQGQGVGGTGGQNRPGAKALDAVTLAKDPEAYRKARREGKLPL